MQQNILHLPNTINHCKLFSSKRDTTSDDMFTAHEESSSKIEVAYPFLSLP